MYKRMTIERFVFFFAIVCSIGAQNLNGAVAWLREQVGLANERGKATLAAQPKAKELMYKLEQRIKKEDSREAFLREQARKLIGHAQKQRVPFDDEGYSAQCRAKQEAFFEVCAGNSLTRKRSIENYGFTPLPEALLEDFAQSYGKALHKAINHEESQRTFVALCSKL